MSTPQWTPDIEIDAALAARLIAEQFPQLAAGAVVPLGHGWDNAAFLVDGRLSFRFPRRSVAANLIKREIALLPSIAPHVPLAIPAPQFIGAPTNEYPRYFAGYPLIDGNTACKRSFTDDERAAFAAPLGTFLRALHAIDPRPLVERGLPPDEIGRLDPEKRLRLARERSLALHRADVDAAAEWLAAYPAVPGAAPRVVHGDLYARHLIVAERGELAGVIDWGDMHLGEPALDLAIAHLVLPASAHAAFRAAYGDVAERTWQNARYRALYHAILEIDYGVRADDDEMRDAGIAGLRLMHCG